MNRITLLSAALAVALLPASAQAPFSGLSSRPATARTSEVSYLFPEQVTIPAGKPSPVDLHFKVADGMHVNSHTPRTEELIPTTIKLPETTGVQLVKADFPPGKDFSLPLDPNEKLSVYTGEFTVHTELIAAKGNHLVEATLHYQACNKSICLPPRSIPIAIDVIAK
jgi:hypothetical protein